jgi:hypothetical protein
VDPRELEPKNDQDRTRGVLSNSSTPQKGNRKPPTQSQTPQKANIKGAKSKTLSGKKTAPKLHVLKNTSLQSPGNGGKKQQSFGMKPAKVAGNTAKAKPTPNVKEEVSSTASRLRKPLGLDKKLVRYPAPLLKMSIGGFELRNPPLTAKKQIAADAHANKEQVASANGSRSSEELLLTPSSFELHSTSAPLSIKASRIAKSSPQVANTSSEQRSTIIPHPANIPTAQPTNAYSHKAPRTSINKHRLQENAPPPAPSLSSHQTIVTEQHPLTGDTPSQALNPSSHQTEARARKRKVTPEILFNDPNSQWNDLGPAPKSHKGTPTAIVPSATLAGPST